MFYSLQTDQDEDQIPPGFTKIANEQMIKNSIRIVQSQGLLKSFNNKKSQFCSKFSLYEDFLTISIQQKQYLFEFDFTVSFQSNYTNRTLIFKDDEKNVGFSIEFFEEKKFQTFNCFFKRSLFQTNFSGKYQIHQKIGGGRTSIVYKVSNKQQNKIYAAKFYSNIPSLIKNQINTLKQLEHPNIIYLNQMFIDQGKVYLIMDYQDGGNLLDQIKSEKYMTMKEKIKFLVDMLNAFEFLRINGIVHRDLKPENILYSKKDGNYKIADFQMAIQQNQPINKLVGTAGYLAPELFQCQKQTIYANQLSDIYSLGLIYYEVATKQTYFRGQSLQTLLKKNKQAKSLKKKKYSKQFISDQQYQILRMMVRKDPDNRLLSLQILQSYELRKIIKEFMIQKSISKSNSTQSPNKSSKHYQEDNELQDNYIFVLKKVLLRERHSQ